MSTATGTRTATKTRFATERSVPAEDDLRGADAVGERMAEERAGSDTPITLVAVRRHWPEAPRGEPRTALESWRSDTGATTFRAAAALSEHDFDQSASIAGLGGDEAFVVLPHTEAVLVRADPQRAAEAADLLAEDFVVCVDTWIPGLRSTGPDPDAPALGEAPSSDENEYEDEGDQDDIWPSVSGVLEAHGDGTRGEGAVLAVLDTGVDADHEEFLDRTIDFVYVPQRLGALRVVRGFDPGGHGTHVAGIAAGRTRGVAPGAVLLAAGVLEAATLGTELSRLLQAVDWLERRLQSQALAEKAAVVNLSLGFRSEWLTTPALRQAIITLRINLDHLSDTNDALLVVASGNEGVNGGPRAPAFFPGNLSVGAVGRDLRPAGFSSSGRGPAPFELVETPDVVGFGVDVSSSSHRDPDGHSRSVRKSGTSMAAPYVSGVAALVAERTAKNGMDLGQHLIDHALPLEPRDRVGAGLARVD